MKGYDQSEQATLLQMVCDFLAD
jgi:hypothetical protein